MFKKMKIKNHKINGVAIDFGKKTVLSTIWGMGSYSDNYRLEERLIKDKKTSKEKAIMEAFENRDYDSKTVEVYALDMPEKLAKKLRKKYKDYLSSDTGLHLGNFPVEKWIDLVYQLKKS